MQCKTCGREISDTAKFCPYCGSKTEPPHNSAENKTAETAYETTANTNAETAYGTKTSKTPETEKLLKTIQKTAFKQHQQAT